MYDAFITKLKLEIQNGLPGWEAQQRMAPMGRSQSLYKPLAENNTRESSILIWLYPKESSVYTRLILRTAGGVHSGQVAFPGGKVEPFDKSFWHTAIREAYEEIGLPPAKVTQIGALTPLFIPPSNFWVHPFIGAGDNPEDVHLSKEEVQQYFDIDIFQLLMPQFKEEGLITLATGEQKITPSYNLQGHTVWGATAMVLSEFEELIRRTVMAMEA